MENTKDFEVHERSNAHADDGVNISNLTAEIESFVKIADTDKEKLRESPEKNLQQPQQQPAMLHIDEDGVDIRSPVPQETKTVVVRVTTTAQILRESGDKNGEKCHTHELNNNNKNNNKKNQAIATDIDTRQSPENNDYYPADGDTISTDSKVRTTSCEKLQNLVTETDVANNNVRRCKKSPIKILIRAPTDDDTENEVDEFSVEIVENGDNNNRTITPLSTEVDEILENACREANRVVSEIGLGVDRKSISDTSVGQNSTLPNESPSLSVVTSRTDIKTIEAKNVELKLADNFIVAAEKKPVKTKTIETVRLDPIITESTEPIAELKITESTDDLTKIPSTKPIPKTTIFEVRNIPLKGFSSNLTRKEIDLRKEQEDDEQQEVAIRNKPMKPTATPTPPQRRRSVKEIIESINKSQSLLKMNQKPTPPPPKDENKYKIRNTFPQPVVERNNFESARCTSTTVTTTTTGADIDVLTANERHMKEMIADMEIDRNGNDTAELAHIPLFVERFNILNNNNCDLFQKCSIKREQTPDNFLDTDNRSSVDWNPLPKPRRIKNSPH